MESEHSPSSQLSTAGTRPDLCLGDTLFPWSHQLTIICFCSNPPSHISTHYLETSFIEMLKYPRWVGDNFHCQFGVKWCKRWDDERCGDTICSALLWVVSGHSIFTSAHQKTSQSHGNQDLSELLGNVLPAETAADVSPLSSQSPDHCISMISLSPR